MIREYIVEINDEIEPIGQFEEDFRPVRLVRCKDCKYYMELGKYCSYDGNYKENRIHSYGIPCHENWFCADGERKG